jgi:hypothetical protein
MPQQELLKKVITVLDRHGIEYMVTGSMASSLHGEPRATHNIDLIVAIRESDVKLLSKAFCAPDYYLEEESMKDAIRTKSMFNLIEAQEGDKIDFWILTIEPFDRSRFSRKRPEEIFGMKVNISSPEDIILAKLQWAKKSGGSEKQFIDALRVFEIQYKNLDIAYLDRWAKNLGIMPLWERLKKEAEIVE